MLSVNISGMKSSTMDRKKYLFRFDVNPKISYSSILTFNLYNVGTVPILDLVQGTSNRFVRKKYGNPMYHELKSLLFSLLLLFQVTRRKCLYPIYKVIHSFKFYYFVPKIHIKN